MNYYVRVELREIGTDRVLGVGAIQTSAEKQGDTARAAHIAGSAAHTDWREREDKRERAEAGGDR